MVLMLIFSDPRGMPLLVFIGVEIRESTRWFSALDLDELIDAEVDSV